MKSRRVGVLLVGTVLMANACATAQPMEHADICNSNAIWGYEGRPMDDADRVQMRIEESLNNTEDGSVPAGVRTLIDAFEQGDPDAITDASAHLLSTCEDEGWEPPEG